MFEKIDGRTIKKSYKKFMKEDMFKDIDPFVLLFNDILESAEVIKEEIESVEIRQNNFADRVFNGIIKHDLNTKLKSFKLKVEVLIPSGDSLWEEPGQGIKISKI